VWSGGSNSAGPPNRPRHLAVL